ncbi:MAG: sulfatase-like hydrolase/transferase [Akkermansiaceae bacterium]
MSHYWKNCSAFILCVYSVALLLRFTVSCATGANQPNIVLIMADDLGYGSLGCYGNQEIKTPNIDSLALNGIRLTDFHSNGPMCTPTRAALMTGRYQQRCTWVDDVELSPIFREQRKKNMKQRWAWGISIDELTIADSLKQAGYRTALFGKWHLGYDFKFHPMNQGFDEFRGFISGAVDYHTHIATSGLKKLDWWKGKKIQDDQGYTTDLLTRYATDFIIRHQYKPFFLFLSHESPHTPLQGRDPAKKKSPEETYREMIEVLDESVGSVLKALRKHRLEKNTLVIFCSDNGPQVEYLAAAGPLRGKKGSMYEGGHRVPFIASWPGVITPISTSSEKAMTMDFFPTFVKLAGGTTPKNLEVDGIDMMPLLKGETKKNDRTLHWLFANSWAVRKGSWKLIGRGGKPLTLVNLVDDLGEGNNLLKAQPERARELMKLHVEWVKAVGEK